MVKVFFPNPFRMDGSWFKGNLHAHSIYSDGVLGPYQLSFLYRASGYNFLFLTDHNVLVDVSGEARRFEDFLLLPGEEINTGRSEVGTSYHLVALNITEEIKPDMDPQSVIDEAKRQGGEAIIAHPYWSSLTVNDISKLNGYLGIEIYNTSCQFSIGKGYSTTHWDDLLVRGIKTLGFAVDDAHWHFNPYRPVDACYAWVMVKAEELSADSIMESLRSGLFYSSNGPQILDMEVNEDSVHVKTSPARAITFIANSSMGRRFTSLNGPLREAEYTTTGRETYIRVEVEDYTGRMAWSNPIILEE